MVSMPEVEGLADAMPDRLRVALVLAAWCQLRRAELLGPEGRDVDLLYGTVQVERTANHAPVASFSGRRSRLPAFAR